MGLLTLLFSAATPENPRFNLNDPLAWDTLGAEPASSGQRITPEIALTHSPWWRGVTLLATDVAKIPLFVLRRRDGSSERHRDHPAYFLLRRKPNDFQTTFTFRRQLTGHAITYGNGYAFINRRGPDPFEMLPLDPTATFPVRANGMLNYITTVNGEMRKLDPSTVLHIKGFSFDGLQGYSVVDKAREDLGLGIGARKYQAIYFRNSGRPAVVLETAQPLKEEAATLLRQSWERIHAGLDNAHRTAVLSNGLSAKVIAFSAEDSQLIQTRQFNTRDVANWLGIPPHKLGDTTRTSFNSLEQEDQAYLDQALDPWLVNWEEECWDKLLTEEQKASDEWEIEFNRKALIRADMATRANYYRTALGGNPWMEVNEVRGEESLDPVPEGEGIPKPKNMDYGPAETPPAKPPKQPAKEPMEDDVNGGAAETATNPPAAAEGGLESGPAAETSPLVPETDRNMRGSIRHLGEALADGLGRMLRRINLDARRAGAHPKQFMAWLETLEGTHGAILSNALDPLENACRAEKQLDLPSPLSRWLLATARDKFLELAGQCTAAQLPAGLARITLELEQLPAAVLTAYLEAP